MVFANNLCAVETYVKLNLFNGKYDFVEDGKIMFKFKNTTEKEVFENTISFQGLKIKSIKSPYKTQKQWNITDRFGNEWNVVFSGNVDDFYLYSVPHFQCDKPFRVDFIMNGNNVEIHRALKNGRNIVSDRLLKQFAQLILMVNCFYKFGYMK